MESAPTVELDRVEFWVDSIARTSGVLSPFGFSPDDGGRPEQHPDERALALRAGDVQVIVREGTHTAGVVARHVAAHGDGVGDVGLACADPEALVGRAQTCGVGTFRRGDATWLDLLGDGTIVHSVRRQPPRPPARAAGGPRLRAIDHVTYCVPYGALDLVARAYQDVLGLATVPGPGRDVGDAATGMRSAVLRAASGFTVVLTEPMSRDSTGQTQRFLATRGGAGVQHLALAYDDLAAAVAGLRGRNVSFLPVRTEHLDLSYGRVGDRALPWDVLRREGILVDADEHGLLFQLFTTPVDGLSGFFFELIHRDGATGFGAGNVRALFAAVDAATGVPPLPLAAGGPLHPVAGSGPRAWTAALVRTARDRIPFYRDHLAGIEGADFSAVPSFDKAMTRRHGRFPMSAGGAAGAHRVLATSGTSGDRLYVSLDEQEWRRTASWLEMVGRGVGMSADDALLNTHCYGLWVGGPALDLLANRCGAGLVPLGPVAPRQVVDLLAQGVGTAISATPSYVRRLVEAAEAADVDLRRTRLRVGFIGAEPAESSIRHKLMARLPEGFAWIELYGLTETGGPAVAFAPEPDVAELTLNTSDFFAEVLDPAADVPVPPGEVGELTLTTRRTDGRTPLVRYRTRDLVRVTAGPIEAPTRISRILARADHSLKIGGVLLYPSAVAEITTELLPASAEWRALVTRQGEDDELVIEVEATRELCHAVERAFRDRIGLSLSVRALPAGSMARSLEKTQRVLIDSPGGASDSNRRG